MPGDSARSYLNQIRPASMAMKIRGKPDELDRVARVIGEETGQCAFLICLLMPMVSRTFVRLILNAPTRHPGVSSCPNGFRLQPFLLSKARARTLMFFSSHPIRRRVGNM